jgi:DNA-binding XRE family transcriptional regulator|nr:MAG TPA: putative transcriptional regulator [Caudoviricetes sp.]
MRERLIEIRTKRGYTQEQMANKLSIARTTYTGYEKGNVSPSLEVALNIKRILNYKNDDIFINSNVC